MKLKWFVKTTAIALLIVVAFFGLASHDSVVAAQDEGSKIEGVLLDQFATDGNADFIVRFVDQADLSAASAMDWDARGEFVYNTLRDMAANSQVNAKALLDSGGFTYQTFISGNELYVWNGTQAAATELAALPEVSFIRATRTFYIDPYMEPSTPRSITWAGDYLSQKIYTTVSNSTDAITDWGILDTQADQFWAAFTVQGDGIVVANIDTGVQWNHPALDQAFRCGSDPTDPTCWEDPSDICGPAGACDNNGHGTHTMGTMVADDDPSLTYIAGMAPNAQWIACKGCETNSCSDFALNTCADWILAPGGDPDNRPNVVNNSWGGGGGDPWYQLKVQAWVAAGVFPAFSAGNSTGCSSLGSPGDYQESFGTTGHNVSRVHYYAQGPSAFGHDPYTKPNITAPAVSVCSSVPTNGWSCGYSGTSMASPHSAGAVALLWSCNPALIGDIYGTFEALQNSADPPDPPNPACGAPPDGEGTYEDGYGYLNVLAAGIANCGGVALGTLDGHVYDSNLDPIEGAEVIASPSVEGNQIQAITDPNGYYTMDLVVGTYDVTASKSGYAPQTVNGVVIEEGLTTTQDFTLSYQGAWTQIPLPPGCPDYTRYDAEYYPGDGLVYIMGGRDGPSGADTFGDVYTYDPDSNTCTDTTVDMPDPVSNYTINLVNNGSADVMCIFGGRAASGASTLTVQCYDPVANSASIVNTLPVEYTNFTPGAQVVVDNMVYVFGGFNPNSAPYELARTDRYDPVANSFTQIGDLSMARSYLDAAVVDGMIYAFGGTIFDGVNLTAQTRTEVMADPGGAGTWDDTAVAELPTATAEGRTYGFDSNSIYELAGKIVIAAGGQWPAETAEAFTYDVATDTYDYTFPDLNTARRDNAGFFVPGDPGSMWVFGGRSGTDIPPYATPEYYDVAVAVTQPVVVVTPPELDITVLPDEMATLPMTITNEGNAELNWMVYDGTFNGWLENFDSYDVGSQMHGQGGWKGWDNTPGAGALVSDAQAHSPDNSVAIVSASDLVHEYSGYTSGTWTYTAWQFVPNDFSGQSYFIMLNTYNDGGPYNWSVQVYFDGATNQVVNTGISAGILDLIKGSWVELRVEIDLDSDVTSFYYGGDLLYMGTWTDEVSGSGVLNIAAVDLFANGATTVYYDDISLGYLEDTPWLSEDPTSGMTPAGESSPVSVMFDATGMGVGVYTTTLYVESDDPVNPMVEVPVMMTVQSVDLSLAKNDSPDPVKVGDELTYTLLVTNNGPQDATGVSVVDTLPVGVTFVSASAGCTELAGVVTCDVGDMVASAVVELDIVVMPTAEGMITNTAMVEGNELDPMMENNTATEETTVIPSTIYIYLPFVAK